MSQPIGVFDSGIGGLSILKALRFALPSERFVYFADSKHNPYGEKPQAFVVERTRAIAKTLVEQHQIKALVVACNTATAAAIHLLRERWPEMPIIGVEPALKPAALATKTGRVLVLATRGTLQSEKFAQLKARVEAEQALVGKSLQFTCVPCDGLAEQIERLALRGMPWQDATDLIANCADFTSGNGEFDDAKLGWDTLVLGCTHYPLIRDAFQSLVGAAVVIVDNAEPVAQRTMQLLRSNAAPSDQAGGVVWLSSLDETELVQAARYWGLISP